MADQLLERELTENEVLAGVNQDYASKYGFADVEDCIFKAEKGLNEGVIRAMSAMKGEPEWMLDYRLKAYQHFLERPMPEWGADLSDIDFYVALGWWKLAMVLEGVYARYASGAYGDTDAEWRRFDSVIPKLVEAADEAARRAGR